MIVFIVPQVRCLHDLEKWFERSLMLAGTALVENLRCKYVSPFFLLTLQNNCGLVLGTREEEAIYDILKTSSPHSLIAGLLRTADRPADPSARPTQKSFCKNARLKSVPPNGAMLCNVSPKWVLETYTAIFSARWFVEQNMPDKGLSLLVISRQSIFLGTMFNSQNGVGLTNSLHANH